MGKKILFNVLLNVLLIACVIVGGDAYRKGNYFLPLVCAAAFCLTIFYKIKLSKQIRNEMKARAEENISTKSSKN